MFISRFSCFYIDATKSAVGNIKEVFIFAARSDIRNTISIIPLAIFILLLYHYFGAFTLYKFYYRAQRSRKT